MNKVTLKCTICHMRYAHVKHYKDHIEKSCSSSAVDNRLIPVNTLDLEMSSTQASSQSLCASYVMDAKTSSVNQLTVEANTDISTAETQASSPQLITKLSCLARQLESQHRCTKVAVDAVVHGVANILAAAGVALDVSALHNSSARKALYCSEGIYVAPVEVTLDCGSKGYIIPLKSLLENLLHHPYFLHCFKSKLDISSSDLLKDFTDGTRFQTHPVGSSHDENLIVMLLYCDDIELANPIGMKRGSRGKLTVFYVSFVNIKASERSKLSNIFLLAVGNSKDLKSMDAKAKLLSDFFSTVNKLQTGCDLQTMHSKETFFGYLLAYSGDSLACHNIAGFKESFSKNVRFACRTCMVATSEFSRFHYEIECSLRTQCQYEKQLLQLEKSDSKKSFTEHSAQCGINSRSVLSKINHFSILTDLLYDPMHVLLEGVVPFELQLFAKFIVREASWISLSQLNAALSQFSFHKFVSKSDYPRPFESDFSFPSSASSTYVLMLHFLFIIDNFVPRNNVQEPHCECFLLLCIITQLLLSPVLSPDVLWDVEHLIARHNELIVRLYGSDAFKPKHHMLLHMSTQIRRFGPSHHHWTMRFEGKNALPKSKKFWNFKNIPLSVADFFQTQMSSDLWEAPGHPKLKEAQRGMPDVGMPFILTSDFLHCGLETRNIGEVASSVSYANVANVKISISDVVVFSRSDGPLFGEVQAIVSWCSNIFFVVHVLVQARYAKHVNAFVLLKTTHTMAMRSESLLYPWPLFVYSKDDNIYGITKCLHECPL